MSCGGFYPLFSPGEETLLDQTIADSSELTSHLGLDLGLILASLQSPVLERILLSRVRENPTTLGIQPSRPAFIKSAVLLSIAMVLSFMETVLNEVSLTILTDVRIIIFFKHPSHSTAKTLRVRTVCCLGSIHSAHGSCVRSVC